MTTAQSFLAILLSLGSAVSVGFGSPVGIAPVSKVFEQADAVVVASVKSVTNSGATAFVSLNVRRVVKGGVSAGQILPVVWSASAQLRPGEAGAIGGNSGIWFLKQSGSAWQVLPVLVGATRLSFTYIPAVPGELPARYAYGEGTGPATRLTLEIAAAAENPSSAETIARFVSSGALDGLGPEVLMPLWSQLSSSAIRVSQIAGLAGQIRLGMAAGLVRLSVANPRSFPEGGLYQLSTAVCGYTAADSASVTALAAIAASALPRSVTTCAAHALRAIHSTQSATLLVSLLDSSVPIQQYEAVAGIASFAMGLPVQTPSNLVGMSAFKPLAGVALDANASKYFPTFETFTQRPQVYTSHWKEWAGSHLTP